MTSGTLWDRLTALVEAQGFVRSLSTFDFDQQPDTRLHAAYHLTTTRVGATNYLGGQETPQVEVEVFLARKRQRDAWGAARQLKVDLDLLMATIVNDYPAYDYFVLDDPAIESEVQPPGAEKDFVIGRLALTVEFD